VVAVLVITHVVAITLAALPSPGGGLNLRDWDQPTVHGEFEGWRARLDGVGVHLTTRHLKGQIYRFARGYSDARRATLRPFEAYYRYVGANQSWRMFVAPHRHPSRLRVRVRQGGSWRLVYQARSPVYTWLGPQLDHDRFRSALFRYGWGQKLPGSYRSFTEWVARRAAHDFPDADEVEVGFDAYETPTPEQVRAHVAVAAHDHRMRRIPLEPLR